MSFVELQIEKMEQKADELLPDYMVKSFLRYLSDGIEPGGFLTALLSNNFIEAAGRADSENIRNLGNWAKMFCYVPTGCYGSPDSVRFWINSGGLKGIQAKTENELSSNRNFSISNRTKQGLILATEEPTD